MACRNGKAARIARRDGDLLHFCPILPRRAIGRDVELWKAVGRVADHRRHASPRIRVVRLGVSASSCFHLPFPGAVAVPTVAVRDDGYERHLASCSYPEFGHRESGHGTSPGAFWSRQTTKAQREIRIWSPRQRGGPLSASPSGSLGWEGYPS